MKQQVRGGGFRPIMTAWGPTVAWMAVIFFFSTRQRITVSPTYALNFLFFKTLHVLEYAMLFALMARSLSLTLRERMDRVAVSAFILTAAYAMSDELHQLFIPTREGSLRDGIIDALGAFAAWSILRFIVPGLPRKLRQAVNSLAGPYW